MSATNISPTSSLAKENDLFSHLMPTDCSAIHSATDKFDMCTVILRIPSLASNNDNIHDEKMAFAFAMVDTLLEQFAFAGDVVIVVASTQDKDVMKSRFERKRVVANEDGEIRFVHVNADSGVFGDWFWKEDVVKELSSLRWSCVLLYDIRFPMTLDNLVYAVQTWQGHFFSNLVGFSHFGALYTKHDGVVFSSSTNRLRSISLLFPGALVLSKDVLLSASKRSASIISEHPQCASVALNVFAQEALVKQIEPGSVNEKENLPKRNIPFHQCPFVVDIDDGLAKSSEAKEFPDFIIDSLELWEIVSTPTFSKDQTKCVEKVFQTVSDEAQRPQHFALSSTSTFASPSKKYGSSTPLAGLSFHRCLP
eukprot:m.24430 g.24430  ORF g.24430 m.24430 type:complete len:366 (-) comp5651_c0_seq1:31-1128(-)